MAKIRNTRKKFNFVISINGIEQMTVQKITFPKVSVDKVEHGENNRKRKTPGMVNIDDLVLEKLQQSPVGDNRFWQWLLRAQNIATGSGSLIFEESITISELNAQGLTARAWLLTEVWVCEFDLGDFDRNSSDAMMEKITLAVGTIEQIV